MLTFKLKRGTVGLVFAILLCCLVVPTFAQKATLTGTVKDKDDASALPGANVVVAGRDVETGAATKTDGTFKVKNLPPGTYTLTVSYIGYETKVLSDITLAAGETKNIDIALALTGIEINPIAVTASRRAEKTLDAPASISVLEAREITTLVAPSSSTLLKNVTGIDMSTTGVDRHEIVLRGFNNAFSGAAYVLTDNRQASVASLAVNVHSIMPNMSVDLDRVEIVRGPGSALYGAGVDAGVIHYITKDPFQYPGTTLSFAGGERSTISGQFRHAGVVGKVGYKITGQYAQANDFKLNPSDPLDAEQLGRDLPGLNRNYDYKKFNINGLVEYRFNEDVSLIANGGFSQLDAIVLSGIGTLQADGFGYSYGQVRLKAGRFFAQTYLNKNDGGDSFVYGSGQKVVDSSTLFNAQAQYDVDFADGKEQVIFGVDYDRTTPDTKGTIYGRNEDKDLISETGFYAQSLTKLSPKFDVTLAARLDYNNVVDEFQFSPRVALVYKPTPANSFRVTYNRAFSSPGNNSNFLDIPAGVIPRFANDPDPIIVRGRGSAFGFEFGHNPAFSPFAGTDLVAYSLNPANVGQPQPVGLPLDATYAAVFQGLRDFATMNPSAFKALLPPPLNQLPDAQIAAIIGLFDPSLTQVSGFSRGVLGLLNPSTGEVSIINDVTDIQPLKQTTTQTVELGYKGVIADKILFSVDGYYMNKKNFVSPLRMETPFVLVPNLSADLQAALAQGIQNNAALAATLGGAGLTPEQVAALIVQLAGDQLPDPSTPVAIVAPNQNAPNPGETPELMLAYRNFGNINLWGLDIAFQALVSERLTLFGNLSVVSDDFFDNKELDEPGTSLSLALNAPTFKTKFGFAYSVPFGVSFNASGRYTQGFPVESGPYVGNVDDYFLIDAGVGYDLGRYAPGMRIDVTVQNLLDNDHREFIGAPKVGRIALARLVYSFR